MREQMEGGSQGVKPLMSIKDEDILVVSRWRKSRELSRCVDEKHCSDAAGQHALGGDEVSKEAVRPG